MKTVHSSFGRLYEIQSQPDLYSTTLIREIHRFCEVWTREKKHPTKFLYRNPIILIQLISNFACTKFTQKPFQNTFKPNLAYVLELMPKINILYVNLWIPLYTMYIRFHGVCEYVLGS